MTFSRFFNKDDEDIEWEESKPKMDETESKRITGKIIKLELDGGWGFISSKDIKFTRIFLHWTALQQDTLRFDKLKKGMIVEFTPVEVEGKGIRATRVKVIEQ